MRQRQKDNTSRVIEVIKIGRRSDQRGRGHSRGDEGHEAPNWFLLSIRLSTRGSFTGEKKKCNKTKNSAGDVTRQM